MKSLEYEYLCKPRFEDMDAYGIVHHSRYLVYIEEAKLSFMNKPEYFNTDIMENKKIKFVVTKLELKYLTALRYVPSCTLTIKLRFSIKDDMMIKFDFEVFEKNTLLCKGYTIHVCVDENMNLKLSLPRFLVDRYHELIQEKT